MEKKRKTTPSKSQPQKQWDVPPGERTSDPDQQQVERVKKEGQRKIEGKTEEPAEDKSVREQLDKEKFPPTDTKNGD